MEKHVEDLKKFEKTRLLSARALQISQNAPLMIKQGKETTSYDLALKEFKAKKNPLRVLRKNIKEDIDSFE